MAIFLVLEEQTNSSGFHGAYSSREKAKESLKEILKKPGKYKEYFVILKVEVK